MGKRRGKRRWFQFSLRLMFVVITLCAVLLGLRMWQVRQRQQALDAVRKLGGSVLLGPEAPVPEWLQPLVFPKVIIVNLEGTQATNHDLARLSGLKGLQTLKLSNTKVTSGGLEPLSGLVELRTLWLAGTGITDADLVHLGPLRNLATLDLSRTQVTDAGLKHLGKLSRLEELRLFDTQVTDVGLRHLAGLSRLKRLSLEERHITAAGIKHLQRLTGLQTILVHVPSGLGKRARDLLWSLSKVQSCGLLHVDGSPIWEASVPWRMTPAGVAEFILSTVELKPKEEATLIDVLVETRRRRKWGEPRPVFSPPRAEEEPIRSVEELIQAVRDGGLENVRRYVMSNEARKTIPALLELLEDRDYAVRRRCASILVRIGLDDEPVRAAIARMFKAADPGERAGAAYIFDDTLFYRFGDVGLKIGPEEAKIAVPLLLAALEDESPRVRRAAVEVLGNIGHANPEQAKVLLPALIEMLRDEDQSVSHLAAWALGLAAEASPQEARSSMPILLGMLKSSNAQNRPDVVTALGDVARLNPEDAKAAVPLLLEILRDEAARPRNVTPKQLRRAVLADDALGRIVELNPEQLKTIVPELLRMLQDEDEQVRAAAVRAFSRIAQAIYTSAARGSGVP